MPPRLGSRGLILIALGLLAGLLWPGAVLAQTAAPGVGHLYLAPGPASDPTGGAPRISLATHTVDIRVQPPTGGSSSLLPPLLAQVAAGYRLQNPGSAPATLVVSLAPLAAADLGPLGRTQGSAANIALQAGSQVLPLQPSLDRPGFVAQVVVPANGRLDLRLTYDLPLGTGGGGAALVAVAYSLFPLAQWPGGPESTRISLFPPPSLPGASWLRTEPEGWTFDGQEVRWLYENRLPRATVAFQAVHPLLWLEISNGRRLAAPGGPTSAFLDLAAALRQVYTAPTLSAGNRRSFYAQTLSAYVEGLTNAQATSAPAAERADLLMGLADLYRTQAVDADGRVDLAYVDLTIATLQEALAAAPAGTSAQMEQWLVEALRLKLAQTQARQEWSAAAQAVDQLAALPPDRVDPALLAQARRAILLQQAIQFLNQGNQAAAMALAGPEIANADLLPPAPMVSLFHSWQANVTVVAGEGRQPPRTRMELVGQIAPGQDEAALAAGQRLLALWADSPAQVQVELDAQPAAESRLILRVSLPDGVAGPGLAPGLLASPEWGLLRALVGQAAPQRQSAPAALWQEITLIQRLDLRPATDVWRSLARELNSQAAEWESAQVGLSNPGADAAQAEQVLQARIRAANYRSAAQVWQDLAEQSQVFVTLTLGETEPLAAATRSWVVSAQDPPATMQVSGRALDRMRLLLAGGGFLVILIVVAGLLWRLL